MTFTEKILKLRKQAGFSQEELAEKLEVSRQAISRWELGSAVPDANNLLHMSKLFGVTVDYLINEEYESDGDIPIVKETEEKIKAENALEHKYHVLILFQIAAFILETLAVVLGDFAEKFFIPPQHSWYSRERVITFIVLFSLGIVVTLCGIILFEVIFGKCEKEIASRYRKRYYRKSVWLFACFPIICSFFALMKVSRLLPVNTAWLLGMLIYIFVCCIVRMFTARASVVNE